MNQTRTQPSLKVLYTDTVKSIRSRGKTKNGGYFFEVYFTDCKTDDDEIIRWGLYFNRNNTIPYKIGDLATYQILEYGLNYIIKFHNLNLK